MSKVIFLNGVGSSGKTSIARSIQEISLLPWLYLAMDNFIDMLPEKFIGLGSKANEGYYSFLTDKNEEKVDIKVTKQGKEFFARIPYFAEILSKEYNIIIDEVLLDDEFLKTYVKHLSERKVYFIGIFCSLEELQKREKARSDRVIGLAKSQIDIVHSGFKEYDFKIDSSHLPPQELARQILNFEESTPNPQGFISMSENENFI